MYDIAYCKFIQYCYAQGLYQGENPMDAKPIKLAEALLRRKELQAKVEVLKKFKDSQVFYEVRGDRKKVTEGIDEISANFPKLDANQVTAEYDHAARQLRLIDAAIQQTNWTAEISVDAMVMEDFPHKKKAA
jgi:hypothetical protein